MLFCKCQEGKQIKRSGESKEVDLEGGIGNDKGRESCAENLPASTDTDMKWLLCQLLTGSDRHAACIWASKSGLWASLLFSEVIYLFVLSFHRSSCPPFSFSLALCFSLPLSLFCTVWTGLVFQMAGVKLLTEDICDVMYWFGQDLDLCSFFGFLSFYPEKVEKKV